MNTRKTTKSTKSTLVWRISAEVPQGQWVDPTRSRNVRPKDNLPEVSYVGWGSSSFDLLSGVDVSDDPDTMPDALFDELFAPKEDGQDDPDGSSSSEPGGTSSP